MLFDLFLHQAELVLFLGQLFTQMAYWDHWSVSFFGPLPWLLTGFVSAWEIVVLLQHDVKELLLVPYLIHHLLQILNPNTVIQTGFNEPWLIRAQILLICLLGCWLRKLFLSFDGDRRFWGGYFLMNCCSYLLVWQFGVSAVKGWRELDLA